MASVANYARIALSVRSNNKHFIFQLFVGFTNCGYHHIVKLMNGKLGKSFPLRKNILIITGAVKGALLVSTQKQGVLVELNAYEQFTAGALKEVPLGCIGMIFPG